MFTGRCSPLVASSDSPRIEVVDVAEAARLRAVAEHGERLARERLADERRDRAPVVRPHPRAVRVEDPDDARVDALLAVVRHRQRLGVALRLVVDAARADRVDVAPVGLGLRMHLRVAVDLARRREQEAGALPLREAERVVRSVRADLERLERQAQIVDRARPGSRGGRRSRPARRSRDARVEIVVDERERVAAEVLDVLRATPSRGCRRRSPGSPPRRGCRRGASRGTPPHR